MHENRHKCRSSALLPALLITMAFGLFNCTVYTIDKSHLEDTLKPKQEKSAKNGGLNRLLSMYKVQYNNHVDTLICLDQIGTRRMKRLTYDSKITVITTDNKAIRFYAKTLYIWKDEFLIGERTSPSLRSPNYFPVKLKDIARIEVRG